MGVVVSQTKFHVLDGHLTTRSAVHVHNIWGSLLNFLISKL